MSGFTVMGHPITGKRYIISQEGVLPPTECRLVGKIYGKTKNHLKGVILEEPGGARTSFPWPIETSGGTPPIEFHPA